MDLRRLHYFVTLAAELHYGRAAARLHMAQPALSHAIQRLESEVGARLFDRSARQVTLTDAGRALLVGAQRILADVERTGVEVRRAAAGEVGSVTVGCMSAGLYGLLTRALPLLRMRSPGISVAVRELATHEQVIALLAGDIDLGLLRPPIDDELTVRTIREDPYVVALDEEHDLAANDEIALADLAAEDFIYFPRAMAPGPFDRLIAACAAAGFSPRLVHRAERPESAVGLVSCGLGVALVSGYIQQVHVPRVVYRPLAGAPLRGLIAAAWRGENPNPAAQSLLAAITSVTDAAPGA